MVFYVSWAANAVLFVAACFLAADTANAIFASWLTEPEAAIAPPVPGGPSGPAQRGRNRQVIVERNLFNSAQADGSAAQLEIADDLEATKLPLQLLGTAAAEDPAYAWAAVQDKETRETLVVTIGDILKQKAEVLRIERRRVVLSEDGEPRELTLDEEDTSTPSITRRSRPARSRTARRDPAEAIRQLAENRFSVPREEVERAIENPSDLLSQARFLPKYEGDQMVGFQVSAIKRDSVLREFGLEDGDVITSFNGIAIDSPAESARLMSEFNESEVIDLGLEGKPNITIDLGN